ncbi:hypothetical protein BDV93DRAFT_541837 [Ceratobasidium sp. AG-I]|nr:hypothetical protein BDV93DRAFT_541837 [Ceratobasidium sp. AG-I]
MSDPASSPKAENTADSDRIAEAALRRLNQSATAYDDEELRYEQERPIRQKFRRLADPGIIRDNNEATTKKAFEILLKISQNLLSDPENPKFREFKSTNPTIQRALLDPKGAIEYAIEMGFRASVQNFQPKYVWHSTPQNLVALRVGSDIIREHVELITAKEERSHKSKQTVAQEKAVAVQNALLAFEDDRKTRRLLDARMKQSGSAPSSPMRHAPVATIPQSPTFQTQGSGEVLGGPSSRRGFIGEGDDIVVSEEKPVVDE